MCIRDRLLPPLFEATPSRYSRKDRQQLVRAKLPAEKTQGQLAREKAREDLKKKRSAGYLRDEKTVIQPSRVCLLYTSPSPRDRTRSRMPSSA